MLPEDWKKEIDDTIDRATARCAAEQQRANEIQEKGVASIKAVADALESSNSKQAGYEQNKDRREKYTRGALIAAAVFTAALVCVSILQWCTLEKTDETMRAGQRAFVFLKNVAEQQSTTSDQKSNWVFLARLENNGNTQTINAITQIACERSKIKELFAGKGEAGKRHVLGPKQDIGGGICTWAADALESDRQLKASQVIGGIITYDDVFRQSHVTKFCREIFILTDPRPIGTRLQYTTSLCLDALDCADKECKDEK